MCICAFINLFVFIFLLSIIKQSTSCHKCDTQFQRMTYTCSHMTREGRKVVRKALHKPLTVLCSLDLRQKGLCWLVLLHLQQDVHFWRLQTQQEVCNTQIICCLYYLVTLWQITVNEYRLEPMLHTHTHTNTHTHTHTHTHMYACTCTHMHAHTHMLMHACVYTHTYM